jgi:hypothetical protein
MRERPSKNRTKVNKQSVGTRTNTKYVPAIGIRKFQKFQTQMNIALSGKGKKHQNPSNSKL